MEAIATRQASFGPLSRFAGILRSELCKLRSVRSTFWTLLAAVVFNVGLAALLAMVLPGRLSAHEKATIDATRLSLGGLHLSQIAIGLIREWSLVVGSGSPSGVVTLPPE